MLGIKEHFCSNIAQEVIAIFKDVYPELERNKDFVLTEISREESKFRNTVEQGLKEFDKLMNGFRIAFEKTGNVIKEISGKQAFKLYDTYGFPLEMTQELAIENGLTVNVSEFEDAFRIHQELSRVGAEQKFAGGLADHSEMSTKYHTATHLLHATLLKVLGPHAMQRGSNITHERMRFDFSHPQNVTTDQLKQVENTKMKQEMDQIAKLKERLAKLEDNQRKREANLQAYDEKVKEIESEKIEWDKQKQQVAELETEINKKEQEAASEKAKWEDKRKSYAAETDKWSKQASTSRKAYENHSNLRK
jgi:alanyl-tRNA synthetase